MNNIIAKNTLYSRTINVLLQELHRSNISYCHWKSNEHLQAAMCGDTDLDMLFKFQDFDTLTKLFNKCGFQLYEVPKYRRYPHIYDFISIDPVSNKIIHLHAHFRLIIGKSGIKNYHLDIEPEILNNRMYNDEMKVYYCSPFLELYLLLIRLGLKYEPILWKENKGQKDLENFKREFNWLIERVGHDKFEVQLNSLSKEVVNIYHKIREEGFEHKHLLSLSHTVKAKLKDKRLIKNFLLLSLLLKQFQFQYSRVKRKLDVGFLPKRRVNASKGIIIALLGSDGSGKSTQIIQLRKSMSPKIDVDTFYMGSNKGSRSKFRSVLEVFKGKFLKNKNLVQKIVNLLIVFAIAFEKRMRMKKASLIKKSGGFVICDRYPQTKIFGYNDGPLMFKAYSNTENIFLKLLLKLEHNCYSGKGLEKPDLVFKLIANPDTLIARRNMSLDDVNRKQDGIKILDYPESKVFTIDADKSIEQVTSQILNHIKIEYFNKI